jgi:hypothetical protein
MHVWSTGTPAPNLPAGSPSRSERLEQTYLRAPDEAARHSYDYAAPGFGFACQIAYDESGLVLNYPAVAIHASYPAPSTDSKRAPSLPNARCLPTASSAGRCHTEWRVLGVAQP